jgi:steroid delta-isomerase-like uncharacterized protein
MHTTEEGKMENRIQSQRVTVDEHIRAENAKDWSAVYDTFVQNENAYFDPIPLGTRFNGISGVIDFYEVLHSAFPDLHITVTGEYDTPGCSIREVTITGTHHGEFAGMPASGNPTRIEAATFFIFGADDDSDKLLAERVYYDNEILMRQIRGEHGAPAGTGLAELPPL